MSFAPLFTACKWSKEYIAYACYMVGLYFPACADDLTWFFPRSPWFQNQALDGWSGYQCVIMVSWVCVRDSASVFWDTLGSDNAKDPWDGGGKYALLQGLSNYYKMCNRVNSRICCDSSQFAQIALNILNYYRFCISGSILKWGGGAAFGIYPRLFITGMLFLQQE